MQSRFQAEINSLQMEVDKRDEMIAKLQRQLQMVGSIRPDSPIPQSSSSLPSIDYPQDQFQIQTMLSGDGTDNGDVNENDEEENENLNDNDEEYPSNYFAVRTQTIISYIYLDYNLFSINVITDNIIDIIITQNFNNYFLVQNISFNFRLLLNELNSNQKMALHISSLEFSMLFKGRIMYLFLSNRIV